MPTHRSLIPPRQPVPAGNRQVWHDLPDLQQHHFQRRRLNQLRWMASIACAGVTALWCGPLLWSWLRHVTA